ncbi:MAG: ABC transporter permease [Chitinispirillaceae bacterium]|nr:ABC transporter permease [Chitinispirillaceae bacterium]
MGTWLYFFKEAVRGFYQAKLMTFVSIVSIAVSLFFMNCLFVVFVNVNGMLQRGTDQADLAVYLREHAADDSGSVAELTGRIGALKSVKQVHYIGKDAAWDRFAAIYGNEMLESVDDNPLPASLEIYLKDGSRSQEDARRLADLLGGYDEVESVRYSREWIDLVKRFQIAFWLLAFVAAVVIVFILYFMISNTIKLTIYARKELVAHMQVVGATAFFVQMPFLLEGVLQGFVGGVLSIGGIVIVRVLLLHFSIDWGPKWLSMSVILVGVVFGWLGSSGAVRKFLV